MINVSSAAATTLLRVLLRCVVPQGPRLNFWFRAASCQLSPTSVGRRQFSVSPIYRMQWHIELLTTPGPEIAQASVMVHMGKQRYLFNCPEGTQRFCTEHRVRLAKLGHVFLTRVDWQTLGGLPGMLLTVGTAGAKTITLVGGPNSTQALVSARYFIQSPGFSVQTREIREQPHPSSAQYGELTVTPVLAHSQPAPKRVVTMATEDSGSFKRLKLEATEAVDAIAPDESKHAQLQHMLQGMFAVSAPPNGYRALVEAPPTTPQPIAISYICQGPTRPGKFDVAKAKALEIPPGHRYSQLVKGETVTLDDGRVIEPHQCVGPSEPGGLFVVVDCPSLAYLDDVINASQFDPYYGRSLDANPVACIVHIVSPEVLSEPRYAAWMHRFGPHTHHLVTGYGVSPHQVEFASSVREKNALNLINPHVFALPYQAPVTDTVWTAVKSALPASSVLARSLIRFLMAPRKAYDAADQLRSQAPEHYAKLVQTAPMLKDFRQEVDRLRLRLLSLQPPSKTTPGSPRESSPSPRSPVPSGFNDVILTTLGTGSSCPSKYRNVSANLLTIPHRGHALLDVGEGTLGQLYRLLGEEQKDSGHHHPLLQTSVDQCIRDLHFIYVSHMHADHHLGLVGILRRWDELTRSQPGSHRNLTIMAPRSLLAWLREYDQIEPLGLDAASVTFIDAHHMLMRPTSTSPKGPPPSLARLQDALGISVIHTCLAYHCPSAYCITMQHEQGWRVSYSGDTRPSTIFAEMGRHSDLLIHESTLEDDMPHEARAKRHCTTSEALAVAASMKARYTMLTHFSQRYPLAPVFARAQDPENVKQLLLLSGRAKRIGQRGIGVAFDMMSVQMKDFDQLAHYTPALKSLYPPTAETSWAS
ncbi:hypothetical protein H4R34_001865 [Dimargaris verticillata]|uniref:ribonuclease Z n=1 Tax=Dimargaris verticillata TaxID=2761393 RepID=A0A9W8EDE3_9FUNG|nr:hypothetical protein H4R34_001865 [Dimargaris verticillata]